MFSPARSGTAIQAFDRMCIRNSIAFMASVNSYPGGAWSNWAELKNACRRAIPHESSWGGRFTRCETSRFAILCLTYNHASEGLAYVSPGLDGKRAFLAISFGASDSGFRPNLSTNCFRKAERKQPMNFLARWEQVRNPVLGISKSLDPAQAVFHAVVRVRT